MPAESPARRVFYRRNRRNAVLLCRRAAKRQPPTRATTWLHYGSEAALPVDMASLLLVGQRPLDNRAFHQNRDRSDFPDRVTVHTKKIVVKHDQVGKLPYFD